MRMIKCEWKNEDGKMPNGNKTMIKSWTGFFERRFALTQD